MAEARAAICRSCGDLYELSEFGPVPYYWDTPKSSGCEYMFYCRECKDEIPCVDGDKRIWRDGMHGEVLVLSEQEEHGIIVTFTDFPWSEVPRHQAGYCSLCKCKMHWNVAKQRWSTVPPDPHVDEPDFDPGLANPRRV